MRQKRFASALTLLLWLFLALASVWGQASSAPVPVLKTGQTVDWWFVFKFNVGAFPSCGGTVQRACIFGGTVQPYKFSQQYAFASSADPTLKQGGGCVGDTTTDPLGATFGEVYGGHFFYALWNDQFYGDPVATMGGPWGHSKGMLAWNQDGNGFVMQVSTPSWPAAGSKDHPRKTDGNTLGCIADDDVLVSQHFFAVKLNKSDLVIVLKALANASVVTDPSNSQIVNNGGPADVQALVKGLGAKVSTSKTPTIDKLSTGVRVISKPSNLQVPTWQLVSSLLDGQPSLRAATWWAHPEIPSTAANSSISCWDSSLKKPGPVEIATSGTWNGKTIGLEGVGKPTGNHAKVGVTTSGHPYAIFGDMNQQGALSGNCKSSQNGRGGLFYVVDNAQLAKSVGDLIKGDKAPAQ